MKGNGRFSSSAHSKIVTVNKLSPYTSVMTACPQTKGAKAKHKPAAIAPDGDFLLFPLCLTMAVTNPAALAIQTAENKLKR